MFFFFPALLLGIRHLDFDAFSISTYFTPYVFCLFAASVLYEAWKLEKQVLLESHSEEECMLWAGV